MVNRLQGKTVNSFIKTYGKLLILLLIPIAVFLIPVEGVEANPAPCLYRIFLKKECIGCGITRAMLNVMHLNFERAIHYNKLVVIVFPLITVIYGSIMLKEITGLFGRRNNKSTMV